MEESVEEVNSRTCNSVTIGKVSHWHRLLLLRGREFSQPTIDYKYITHWINN